MDKKVIYVFLFILAVFIGIIIFTAEKKSPEIIDENGETVYSLEMSREIAENWVLENSSTYKFDGSNLELISEGEIAAEMFIFNFSFTSSAAGYGDRTDQMLAQVITEHEIEVIVDRGNVVSAVINDEYCEMNKAMIEPMEDFIIDVALISVIDGQESVTTVERKVTTTRSDLAKTRLLELLSGPSEAEKTVDLSTSIPEGVSVLDFYIENGVAYADFDSRLEEGVAGSAWVTSIIDQITTTLVQDDDIVDVVISIEGRVDDILQP